MNTRNNEIAYHQVKANKERQKAQNGEASPMRSVNGFAPVDPEVILRNRIMYAARLAGKETVNKSFPTNVAATVILKKSEMLSAVELKKRILSEKNARIRTTPLPKTWEDSKPCKNEENGAWRDGPFRSSAIGICRNTCTLVLECLENDRIMGGEPGTRAGMDQAKRQDIYLREPDLGGVADAIYVARALMKLELS